MLKFEKYMASWDAILTKDLMIASFNIKKFLIESNWNPKPFLLKTLIVCTVKCSQFLKVENQMCKLNQKCKQYISPHQIS